MIKYLGSKRLLVPRILAVVEALSGVRTVLDLFSGTSRVGHALKARGYRVVANDHNTFAWRARPLLRPGGRPSRTGREHSGRSTLLLGDVSQP